MGFWGGLGRIFTGDNRADTTVRAREDKLDNMGQQLMDERGQPAYQPERVTAQNANFDEQGQAQGYESADPGLAQQYQAALAADPDHVGVDPLNPVERVSADKLGEAHGVQYNNVAAAGIESAGADQIRGQQGAYLQNLQNRAAGNAPSVAENAYLSKQADVANNALGIAGQARGSDKAYARLHAMDAIADGTRKAAFESAQLRAGEMDKANEQLGSQLGSVRGQDVDVAKTAAQLRQEAALANQRTGLAANTTTAEANNRREEFGAGQDLQAKQLNQQAGNTRTMDEAQLKLQAATGNATRDQAGDEFNAQAQNQAAATNAAAQNSKGDLAAQLKSKAAADLAAAQNARSANNAAARNQNSQFNATQGMTAQAQNQTSGLQGAQLANQHKEALGNQALAATGQATQLKVAETGKPKDKGILGDVIKGASEAGVAALSDERAKKDIHDVPDHAAERLASALQFKEFKYKPEVGDDAQHVGVMAQDLERDPLGKKLVSHDAEGLKHVDYQGLTSLLLAAALRGKKEARR